MVVLECKHGCTAPMVLLSYTPCPVPGKKPPSEGHRMQWKKRHFLLLHSLFSLFSHVLFEVSEAIGIKRVGKEDRTGENNRHKGKCGFKDLVYGQSYSSLHVNSYQHRLKMCHKEQPLPNLRKTVECKAWCPHFGTTFSWLIRDKILMEPP